MDWWFMLGNVPNGKILLPWATERRHHWYNQQTPHGHLDGPAEQQGGHVQIHLCGCAQRGRGEAQARHQEEEERETPSAEVSGGPPGSDQPQSQFRPVLADPTLPSPKLSKQGHLQGRVGWPVSSKKNDPWLWWVLLSYRISIISTVTLSFTSLEGDRINSGLKFLPSPKSNFQRAVSFKPLPGKAVSTGSWHPDRPLRGLEDSPCPPHHHHLYPQRLVRWVYMVWPVSSLQSYLAPGEVTGLSELGFSGSRWKKCLFHHTLGGIAGISSQQGHN